MPTRTHTHTFPSPGPCVSALECLTPRLYTKKARRTGSVSIREMYSRGEQRTSGAPGAAKRRQAVTEYRAKHAGIVLWLEEGVP